MQTPETPVEETWHHYRISYTLRLIARDKEAAQAAFYSYFGNDYTGGVQEEIGFEVVELDGAWNPIEAPDDHLEGQYEELSGDSDLP